MDDIINHYLLKLQVSLPGFFQEADTLTQRHKEIMYALDEIRIEDFFPDDGYRYHGTKGRPQKERIPMIRAFIAKSILNISETKALIDRLQSDPVLRRICGWQTGKKIPCEATFSNVFREFSESNIAEKAHQRMIKRAFSGKIIENISRDSSAIEAREKIVPKKKSVLPKTKKYGKGRPKKGEIRPEKEPTRLEKQKIQTLEEMLKELENNCGKGVKKNSKGYMQSWNGYKLHADVTDEGIAISMVLTSASLHDSQVAIPLEVITSALVSSKYTLADAAYDSKDIRDFISSKNKSFVIDSNPRRGEKKEKTEEEKERYNGRSSVERFFGDLKDHFACRIIMVKGHVKVMAHIMFGILSHMSLRSIKYKT